MDQRGGEGVKLRARGQHAVEQQIGHFLKTGARRQHVHGEAGDGQFAVGAVDFAQARLGRDHALQPGADRRSGDRGRSDRFGNMHV